MTVFVDTSYFIANLHERDQWHRDAVAADVPGLRLVTSSLVVNETISLLQSRGYTSMALSFLQDLRVGSDISVIHVDASLQSEAWDPFIRYAGARASPIDCASFAIMRRHGIEKAFTFDQHFKAAGFSIIE